MKLEKPPGHRSCGVGGAWDYARHPRTRDEFFQTELGQLGSKVSPADKHLLAEELDLKFEKAELGACSFGRGSQYDVDQMTVEPTVLELRLTRRASVQRREGNLEIRVYFTEPIELPGVLLELVLAWKIPGPAMRQDQNKHATRAAKRAQDHLGSVSEV